MIEKKKKNSKSFFRKPITAGTDTIQYYAQVKIATHILILSLLNFFFQETNSLAFFACMFIYFFGN